MLLKCFEIISTILQIFALIFVACLIWESLSSFICVFRKRPPYYKCGGIIRHLELVITRTFGVKQPLWNALICIVLLYGAFSLGTSIGENHAIQYRGIGSDYEANDITYRYDAMLYTYGADFTDIESYLPCIATIYRSDYGDYTVEMLELPYGKSIDINENIYGSMEFGEHYEIDLGRISGYLMLVAPATYASGDALKKSSPQYATFLASKKGDTIHFSDCAYLERIDRKDIIHFSNEIEAEVYGYDICDKCYDKHIK